MNVLPRPFIQDQTEQPDSHYDQQLNGELENDQQSLFERFTSPFNKELDEAPDTKQNPEKAEDQPSNFVPLHPSLIKEVAESQDSAEQPKSTDKQENFEALK